jgi:transglutaminase-like putative cysteine protease
VAVALPLLGGWVASTLAIHHGASRQWAWAAGLGLGLGFPVLWEVLSQPRSRPGVRPQRWLRLRTRLLLRTWVVTLLFLGGSLALSPRGAFTALSTRGDWMLPPQGSPEVETTRRLLFKAASGVEWAYVLATDNEYRDQLIAMAPSEPPRGDPPRPAPLEPAAKQAPLPKPEAPQASPTARAPGEKDPLNESDADVVISWKSEPRAHEPEPQPSPTPAPAGSLEGQPPKTVIVRGWRGTNHAEEPSKPLEVGQSLSYPLPARLHPRVAAIPRSVETDLASVAKYLVEGERDPFQRVKAIHDYIADRVEYDAPGYVAKVYPSPSPEDVFKTRRAVCAGYANLFAAMGKAAGEEVVTISGEAITPVEDTGVGAHAWNAVRIEGKWYLVDVTWDAGMVRGTLFGRSYGTNYLFVPPEQMVQDHLPEYPAWQLLDVPVDRGTFLRQAGLGAQDSASSATASRSSGTGQPTAPEKRPWEGIRIVQPSRPREEVWGRFSVELDNPKGLRTSVILLNLQDHSQAPCQSESGGTRHACRVFGRGLYLIEVFAGAETPSELVAQLEVEGT